MARETKVGLLAGLGFIICFAIILANRGRIEPVTSHVSYVVDEGKDLQSVAQMSPKQDAGRAASGEVDRRAALRNVQDTSLTTQTAPVRTDRRFVDGSPTGSVGSGADVPSSEDDGNATPARLHSGRAGSQYAQRGNAGSADDVSSRPGQDRMAASSPLAAITQQVGGPSLTAASQDQVRRRRALEDRLNGPAGRRRGNATPVRRDQRSVANASMVGGSHGSQTPVGVQRETSARLPVRSSATTSVRRAGRHIVVAGDSLSRIAAKHYGRGSATFISAIFDANRNVLTSRDLVPLGAELIIPVIEVSGRSAGNVHQAVVDTAPRPVKRREAATGSQRSADSQPRGFRWYQIKKSDRYMSIALEQLGDASRWREIFELNKDKFPTPDRIRHGVRIKIPTSRLADAGGDRR